MVSQASNIGSHAEQYRFAHRPILVSESSYFSQGKLLSAERRTFVGEKRFATSDMSKQYTITEILSAEIEALRTIPQDNDYEAAISLILSRVHQGGGRLITSGMGKAGQIAHNIATTFSSTGTPAYFLHPSEAQHGDLGMVCEGDVMLLISNSGKTREVLELVALTRRMYPRLPFILITGNSESPLSQLVDVTLFTGNPAEVCPLGLTPTTSTTVMTVLGDLLVVSVMQRIGFTYHDYSLRHHGGYLGDKSRELVSPETEKK